MKKSNLILTISFAVIASCLFACSDDDESTPTPSATTQSASERLIGKDFIQTDYVIEENGSIVFTFDSLEVCDKDDIIKFLANNTGSFDEGAMKCNASDPQSNSFTWSLLESDTKLSIIDSDSDTTVFDLLQNDGTNLKIQNGFRDTSNDTTTLTITLIKQ